ncbi:MAG: type II toxin-antitoxin system RelE/ParE family toxin [Spirosomataceae bacterium]
MAYEINWSPDSKEDIRDIYEYLLDEWDDKVADKFTDDVLALTMQLTTMPFLGKKHPKMSSVRQLIIRPYNIIYYTVLEASIYILNVVDGRKQ